ncbi:MAG: gliding motility protein GldL [Flavobacteriales bacterium]|jgi:gliding motility-associated protein GldL|nr:gliding motility protein GldL [Flavobacteriales bacterium]
MAQSQKKKQMYNMAYGLGASIVIIGALFKILHYHIGPLTGGLMLAVGMVVEALVFALSAFEPVEEEYDWSLVYPQFKPGVSQEPVDAEGMLAQKLNQILADAHLDVELVQNLAIGIKNFQDASQNVAPVVESIAATNNYSEQLNIASNQMESLNNFYKLQIENSEKQTDINDAIVENAARLKEQMESLATNLSSLNGVYGGMLSAMSNSNN